MNCLYCEGVIKSFGDRRKNGNDERYDFDNRKYHLKCWKILNENLENLETSKIKKLGRSRLPRLPINQYHYY